MKLSLLRIRNFKACKNITLEISDMHALVGGNNAGKSTVLKALDFLFNPSTRSLNEDSFWNRDTTLEIRVEAEFEELNEWESQQLSGCVDQGRFVMARTAHFDTANEDEESAESGGKINIGQEYRASVPEAEWLQEAAITTARISEWWSDRNQLKIGELDFAASLGTRRPGVREWKQAAADFLEANLAAIPMNAKWIPNPKGYANVLKRTLPFFVLIPAVRDVAEESKGTKTSPFGRLLYAVIEAVTDDKKREIEGLLGNLAVQMNRVGGENRVAPIKAAEDQLNILLGDFFKNVDLEIEFQTPTFETIITSPKLFIDDGFRNSIEHKGHGLQRAVIFTILRRYADFAATSGDDETRRSIFLGVEEPELYMHPQAQRTIRKVFKNLANKGSQVIFSTHSSLLVDVSYFDEVIRLETKIKVNNGESTRQSEAFQLPIRMLISDLEARHPNLKERVTEQSIRDLYSHAYNPRRSEGFFANKIILVEGTTEEYSLPLYAEAIEDADLDSQGISVVECGGKGPMDRLYRIFNELRIPCFLLFDYDKENKDTNIIDKSRELLQMCGVSEEDPGTIILANNVACFVHTWERDLGDEIPDVATLTAQARRELGLRGDSGKPLIARYIARKLISADTPIVPPTIEKILQTAVKVEWAKSCLTPIQDGE